MKFSILVISFIVSILCSLTQATWLSKNDFMQQYQDNLVSNFPQEVTNRSVMEQWCNAITNTKLADNKNNLSWLQYSGIYISPNQSIIAYLTCYPFVNKLSDRFPQKLISSINKTKYSDLIPAYDKRCNVTDKSNNLNNCNIVQLINDITLIVLNDLANIRQATSWWYVSTNEEDRWYFAAQHFAYATGKDMAERIQNLNTALCGTPQIPYFWPKKSQQCRFTNTYAEIIRNSLMGETILKNTTSLDGKKIFLNECDQTNDWSNIVWCGINDHSSTQPYVLLISNELWFYKQFMTTYLSIAQSNKNLIIWEQLISDEWYEIVLKQLQQDIQQKGELIRKSINISTQIISDLESKYYIHIWNRAQIEAGSEIIQTHISPFTNNLNNLINDRLNTQKQANTTNG